MSHGRAVLLLEDHPVREYERDWRGDHAVRVVKRRGWTRLLFICKSLHRSDISYNVDWKLTGDRPIAVITWGRAIPIGVYYFAVPVED